MTTDDDRKNILNQFLTILHDISNLEYQKRIWILGEGPEVDDFTETVCGFFDLGDPIFNNYKAYGISDTEYKLLIRFRDLFEIFSDNYSWEPDFIDTSEWTQIREMTKEVLIAFKYKPKSSLV